uniref:(northern house mosquito) hypothetical protein n=1 Tax=Culex pipiens TaxID=7175 RepID=A0A8D8KU78_CULPI
MFVWLELGTDFCRWEVDVGPARLPSERRGAAGWANFIAENFITCIVMIIQHSLTSNKFLQFVTMVKRFRSHKISTAGKFDSASFKNLCATLVPHGKWVDDLGMCCY